MAKVSKQDQRVTPGRKGKTPQKKSKAGARDERKGFEQSKGRAAHDSGTAELRPIKRRRRRRLKLGEAFRKAGLDEQTVAETYVRVVDKLRRKSSEDTVQKLLVDVLKECSRVLDPPRSANASLNDQPAIVELHHDIPRPVRDEFPEPDGSPEQ